VDEPVVREEEAVAKSCVVGFVGHGELRFDWQHFHPCTSAIVHQGFLRRPILAQVTPVHPEQQPLRAD
jgi:hypothetical protein